MSSALPLFTDTFFPKGRPGPPTFTSPLLLHAVLSDPEEAPAFCPIAITVVVSSEFLTSSTLLKKPVNGAQSLQPYGLRPAVSLSTLNSCRYRQKLKTRYEMCWVGTFSMALSATSGQAPRGAAKVKAYRVVN